MRILIAEDDSVTRTLLRSVLTQNAHEVVESVHGGQAWEVMQQPDAPVLPILDWMMPEVPGPELVRRIRSLKTDRPPYISSC